MNYKNINESLAFERIYSLHLVYLKFHMNDFAKFSEINILRFKGKNKPF